MTIKEMREALGDSQRVFAMRYGIPYRSIQNWESGIRIPPDYLLKLLEEQVKRDLINRRSFILPKKDPHKKNLPSRRDYVGPHNWLNDISKILGPTFVFGLDTALMCQELFLGRSGEIIIFGYGDDSLRKYNGVVILGESIDKSDVEITHGLSHTSFNRTVLDAIDNERILDPQGILQGLNSYYVSHNNSFEGLFIPSEYKERFTPLAKDAIEYYTY